MGADRRGPLAAFIIVAVIAGILLVTSVRSQASPGWLSPVGLPATVVAAPVTGGLDQIVHEGVVLVHRAKTDSVDDHTRTESVGPSTSVATPGTHGLEAAHAAPRVVDAAPPRARRAAPHGECPASAHPRRSVSAAR